MKTFVNRLWDEEIVPQLCDYVRIPNKSPAFDPDWETHGYMERAAGLLADWTASRPIEGLRHEIVRLPGRTPLLLCEVPATPGAEGTVLLYGHYDKQPEFSGWREGLGPWEPVLEDGRLYGRGGADDGYALFGCLTAIEALQREGLPHGRCIVVVEGCEESGSHDLPHYMDHLAERIGTPDLVICLDAEAGNYEQLWLTTSLRGMLPGVLGVKVLTEGVHSGMAGNIVPSSFRHLRGLVERVEDAVSGELADVLHVQIPQRVREQAARAAEVLGDSVFTRFPWAAGPPTDAGPVDALIANTWHPSMATVGLSGAPEVGDAGNTLRPETRAKLVFRLPPTLDAEIAGAHLKALLERDPPPAARVSFELEAPQTGWHAPETAPWLEAAVQSASRNWFGRPAMAMGCGGTIPFMKMLADRFPGVQFMVTGVLGPHSNAHGPNEFLHIDCARRVTGCVADVLAAHARRS
ncbi:MAG: M20/M25/M40 family metallo-hydrolase [Gammaproteobacteria bacterium]|nr:M20/M25/M40 family metallo-hydrolase [Gammaproteobacteria bacterium]